MKKTLVTLLALVFVLGIAGTAFAAPANPFVDVPAKHWAYGAVAKLAKAGVVDGYGDGTFRGDRTMTRYEMAQIVAKAMAKSEKADAETKALIDKLAVEFAAELNNLGVRVAKLEKNASSIKFWGDSRIRYQNKYAVNSDGTTTGDPARFQERLRLYMQSDVADNVLFEGRLWVANTSNTGSATATNDDVAMDYAKFTFKEVLPGLNFMIGRDANSQGYGLTSGTTGGFDGVRLIGGGNEVKFMIGGGDISGNGNSAAVAGAANPMAALNKKEGIIQANVVWSPSKDFQMIASTIRSNTENYKYKIYTFGTKFTVAQNLAFTSEWGRNTADGVYNADQRTAWFAQLGYMGADKAKVGTYGLFFNYKRYGNSAVDYKLQSIPVFEAISDAFTWDNGAKGWGAGFNYTVAKNAVFTLTYEDLKALNSGTKHGAYTYAQMNLFF